MKKLLLSAALLTAMTFSAQKIDVKKDTFTIDGNPVAMIAKEKSVMKVSDMKGNFLFSIQNVTKTINQNEGAGKPWLRLTGANGNVREVNSVDTGFTLSPEKILLKNLIAGDAGFFSATGLNTEMLNNFFKTSDTSISQKFDEQYEALKKLNAEEDAAAQAAGLKIEGNGDIKTNGTKVGSIVTISNKTYFTTTYKVYDAKKVLVASLTQPYKNNFLTGAPLVTADNKTFTVNSPTDGGNIAIDELAKRIVSKLLYNGYTLGDMQNKLVAERQKAYNEAYSTLESQSINIVDIPGYVVEKSGKKTEGKIKIAYENIDKALNPSSGMSDISNFGGFVNVTTEDGKVKSFKAKDGVMVAAGKRNFIGAKSANDDALGNGSGSELGVFGESQFFEIDYENAAGYIVHHPRHPQYYYIKLKNSADASYLGNKGTFKTKSDEKMAGIFDKTLNCSAMKFTDYDTNNFDGMKKVLDDYRAKCQK